MFLARTDEQERFSALLTQLVSATAGRGPSNALLVQGLGGMGKSWLLDRYGLLARDFLNPSTGKPASFRIVAIDWEDERTNTPDAYPASTGPRLLTVLAALHAALVSAHDLDERSRKRADRGFQGFREIVKQLPNIEPQVGQPEDPQGSLGRTFATAADSMAPLAGFTPAGPLAAPAVRATGGLVGAISGVAEKRRRARDSDVALEVLLRPEESLLRAFADGVRTVSAAQPVILLLDTYEIVTSCGGWLRQVIRETGLGVLWVLAGRLEPEASAGSSSEAAAFYRELPEENLRVVTLTRFSDATIAQLLTQALGDEARAAPLVSDVATLTRGVPLAVGLVAGLLAQGGNLQEALAAVTESGDASHVVRELATRYLIHALADPTLRNDIPLLYGLALLRGDRADPDLLRALWGVDGDVAHLLDGLARRHDFVLSGSRRLHQEVRDAFRRYLLDAVRRDEMRLANQRAAETALQRAMSLNLASLDERFQDDRWRSTVSAVVWHRFWEGNEPGFEVMAEAFTAAALLQSSLAHELVGIASSFYETFTPGQQSRLRGLASMLSFGGFLDTWLERRRSSMMLSRSLGPFAVARDEATDDDRRTAEAWLIARERTAANHLRVSGVGLVSLLIAKVNARRAPAEALVRLEEAAAAMPEADPAIREQLGQVAWEIRRHLNSQERPRQEALEAALRASQIAATYLPGDARIAFGVALQFGRLDRPDAVHMFSDFVERFGSSDEAEVRHYVAQALVRKAASLGRLDRRPDAIATYEDVTRRFGDATEPELQHQVAMAMVNKGYELRRVDRHGQAIAIYDDVARRFGDATGPELRHQVAMALVNKSLALGSLGRDEEALVSYEDVTRRFGDATEPKVRLQVARALVSKAIMLGRLDRGDEAIATYDDVAERFGDASEPELRHQVAMALVGKGYRLGVLDRDDEAIATYDDVAQRFGDATEPELRHQVAMALVNKASTLAALERREEAITAYGDVARRFGNATELELREPVARALLSKAFTLGRLDRSEEAIATYQDAVRRFGDATEPQLRHQVAIAMVNMAFRLSQVDRSEEAIATYDDVARRFGEAAEPELRHQVAMALINKAFRLGILDRDEEAIAAADDVARRFGDATDPELQRLVANAFLSKGFHLALLGREDEAIRVYDELMRRVGGAPEQNPELVETQAMAFENRAQLFVRQGQLDAAIADLDRAISLAPQSSGEAFVYRAAIASHRGDSDTALALLTRARGAHGNCSPFRAAEMEAIVTCAMGDIDEAENELNAALGERRRSDTVDDSLYRLLGEPPIPGIDRIYAIVRSARSG